MVPESNPNQQSASMTNTPSKRLQDAVTSTGNVAWNLYKSTVSQATVHIVPQETRDALFQLFYDVRTDVPKDAKFLQRHARALKPKTLAGWLALLGIGGYLLSTACVVGIVTIFLSIVGLVVLGTSLFWVGILAAWCLGFFSIVLLSTACVTSIAALTFLTGYAWISGIMAVLQWTRPSATIVLRKQDTLSS